MLYVFWIAVLILTTAYFNHWLKARNNPNQTPSATQNNGVNEVVLQRNPQHHYIANGFINGIEVTFLLDTGATQVSVPKHLAQKLGLKPGAIQYSNTANGTVETRATTINSLTLGTIRWENVQASINPGMLGDEILLGMSALKNVEFTHRNGTLTLRQYY